MICYHCGLECPNDQIKTNEKYFCCNGCKTVYEMLEANNLCNYYAIDETPGISKRDSIIRNFDFLEDPELIQKLIEFSDGNITNITFDIPQMHCSSCVWILENLYKFDPGVIHSEVNFLNKTLSIKFREKETTIKKIVEQLDSLGYLPNLSLDTNRDDKLKNEFKRLYYKIGIAGFSFGNVMLLSFPEYLSYTDLVTSEFQNIFNWISLALSLPVFLYSASEYYISAFKGLKKKIVNIDVPITLGIFVLFFRSLYEMFIGGGVGYLDSMTALVFLLLTGKVFQNKTYDAMNFERNYKSYFPIAVTIKKDGKETTIPVDKLEVGQRIVVKNNELIPADAILISEKANIDYSFVTGESQPVEVINGEMIFAGGKQIGQAIEVETVKEVSQSYLTQLWNSSAFNKKHESKIETTVTFVSKYFTFIILAIAISAFIYWVNSDINLAFNAFTAVLIIACPCALALSTPFTLGNSQRIFGRNKFYVKNTSVVEKLAEITSIVFDKTGTITETLGSKIEFIGEKLSKDEQNLIKALVLNSSHPLSLKIASLLSFTKKLNIENYSEESGKGISATIDNKKVLLGSRNFVSKNNYDKKDVSTNVFVSINEKEIGYFRITNVYRNGLKEIASSLAKKYKLFVLSGDNEGERENLLNYFEKEKSLFFNQSPHDKLNFINDLQNKNEKVLMIGDGLNDAGALVKSDVGISISEDINNFSPACDGIIDAKSFKNIKEFIRFSITSKKIIIISFIISFMYNIIGISFAVQGTLSPVISAILMPISSISIVVFTTIATNFMAKKRGLL
ncbi:MAG: heavy metal translocating P-type ATPase metal-binding domain-containing protein [Bacteroidetes bacterium]|nr:heavy metal translocating P-type ATPase metal-binding domain-containing protein [Bacteroidota bacterium]MBU1114961.1 heavy metal translocating P-type ATPase metal-binding domain-containing protein [Bacteroidota bacterium]MBU1797861.1 heavy metal translocating P-type ATPase metal-binding domain-containing protein [Bacteroidota bacterium]